MTAIDSAKRISCNEAAARLGLKGKRTSRNRGMWCCPFHDDKTPSMCCYDEGNRFFCFGCGKWGDATDLYSQVLGLRPKEAAKRACADFGLSWDAGEVHRPTPPEKPPLAARAMVALCMEWRRLMIEAAQGEIAGCVLRMDQVEVGGLLWERQLARATYYQDMANRYSSMTVGDVLEELKAELAAYNTRQERRVTYLGTVR